MLFDKHGGDFYLISKKSKIIPSNCNFLFWFVLKCSVSTPGSRTKIECRQDIQMVFWSYYVRLIHVLFPGSTNIRALWRLEHSSWICFISAHSECYLCLVYLMHLSVISCTPASYKLQKSAVLLYLYLVFQMI